MLRAALKKEFTLVLRDAHALLVLFAMPVMFILIMSLAMQEQFGRDSEFRVGIAWHSADSSEIATQLRQDLENHGNFRIDQYSRALDQQALLKLDDNTLAYIQLPQDLEALLDEESSEAIELWLSPKVEARTRLLIEAALKEALGRAKLRLWLDDDDDAALAEGTIQSHYIGAASAAKTPSAVQQSVPAWLIFSMFFVAIPISSTLITERQQGTLLRLKSMRVSPLKFLLAKLTPYLIINQLQLCLMLAVGYFLVPLLGGDRLQIPTTSGPLLALLLLALATGLAAVGYGLLVAVIAKTTEQATALGGVGAVLLGAIGGVMVPRFVMPAYLQDFALVSPMSWALDGFLKVFLYAHNASAIGIELLGLSAFGVALIALALMCFRRS